MNMFTTAKPLAGSTAKGKKSATESVQVEGLELFAALKAVESNVKGQIAVVEARIKSGMTDRFVEIGMKTGTKPASYDGVENLAKGSMQFRARSSASPLNEEERNLLGDNDIPFEESTSREETFVINPAYAFNMDMLAKVSEALEGLGLPADFIQKQEKVSKFITTEDSIKSVLKIKDKDTVAALLPLVSTLAIRASLDEEANCFQIVDDSIAAAAKAEAKA